MKTDADESICMVRPDAWIYDVTEIQNNPMYRALENMAELRDWQAEEIFKMSLPQIEQFFVRVLTSRYRTPFMNRLLAESVALRMSE